MLGTGVLGPAEATALPLPGASGPRPGLNRHRQRDGVALLLLQVLGVVWVRHGSEEAHEAQQRGEKQQERGGEEQGREGAEHQQQDSGQQVAPRCGHDRPQGAQQVGAGGEERVAQHQRQQQVEDPLQPPQHTLEGLPPA